MAPESELGRRSDRGEGSQPRAVRRTQLAGERTWLAWWRTALTTLVAGVGVGRLAPEVIGGATWPFAALGTGFTLLALALFVAGIERQRAMRRAFARGELAPLSAIWVELFTVGGMLLVLATLLLILV